MEVSEYIKQIDEQLRAYEFHSITQESIPEATDVYSRETDRLGPTGVHHEVVIVKHIDNHQVAAVESALDTARDVYNELDIEATSRLDSVRLYLLIVAEEATKPMRIRVERAAGELADSDAFLLPVLADLSGSRLLHDEPSTLKRVSTHGRMASDAEKYFRL